MKCMRPWIARLLAPLCLLGAASAQDEEPPDGGAPAAPRAEEPKEPAGKAVPPESIEQAYARLEALRKSPLPGVPGSVSRRRDRLRSLAAQALALDAAKPTAGEDLFRLAEICMDGERFEEAARSASKYLETGGKEPAANAGFAHAIRVRALARLGRVADAEAALDAYRKALPGAEGLSPVAKAVGDALVGAGRLADALVRYREAMDRLPRPFKAGTAATVQALAEALAASGRPSEAAEIARKAAAEAREPGLAERLHAVQRRAEATGRPFEAPVPQRWIGGDEPGEAATRGKVVVWHLFAWWMQSRSADTDDWLRRREDLAGKGIAVAPVTRTGGWDPGAGRFDPEHRKPAEECADIEKGGRERGWKGPVGVVFGEGAFASLQVRGFPMDVVVGRDGKVLLEAAGSEAGHALAALVAARAAAEPPPSPPAPGPDGKAATPSPAPDPGGKKE
jgi:tetratricopeptide (TPR) repeat protein